MEAKNDLKHYVKVYSSNDKLWLQEINKKNQTKASNSLHGHKGVASLLNHIKRNQIHAT